jgi:hypothetical protein
MDFNDAVDVLVGPPIITTIADAAGVEPDTVSRARMRAGNRRGPPKNWKAIVGRMARERIGELTELLNRLTDA